MGQSRRLQLTAGAARIVGHLSYGEVGVLFTYSAQVCFSMAGMAWALCAGATSVNSARGFMFALGCIQSLKCNKNTCPTDITTHDRRLRKGLDPADKAVRVVTYCKSLRHDVEGIAQSRGVPQPRGLRRFHVRIVGPDGKSRPMNELYPSDDPTDESPAAALAEAMSSVV